jgi:alkylated DNA repair dioxygenase AlkB
MNDINSKGFFIVRGLISKKDALELGNHLRKNENSADWKDKQAYGSPSFYTDKKLLTLQKRLLPKIEKLTEMKLFKTYNYARVYKKGAILRMHRDRPACEISVTLDLGGDPWDIYVLDINEKPVKVKLNPGDAIVYRGETVWHWRSRFRGDNHMQVFLHYVDQNGPCAWAKDDILKEPRVVRVKPRDLSQLDLY